MALRQSEMFSGELRQWQVQELVVWGGFSPFTIIFVQTVDTFRIICKIQITYLKNSVICKKKRKKANLLGNAASM